MPHRPLPFAAFVAFAENAKISLLGVVTVVAIFKAGASHGERRQFAVESWHTVDSDVASLHVCNPSALYQLLDLDLSDLRFRNQVAEVNAAAFPKIKSPELDVDGRLDNYLPIHLQAADVPVLSALSASIAGDVPTICHQMQACKHMLAYAAMYCDMPASLCEPMLAFMSKS